MIIFKISPFNSNYTMSNKQDNDQKPNKDGKIMETSYGTVNDWLNKYRPSTISDLITNRKAVNEVCEWLSTYYKKKQAVLKMMDQAGKTNKKVNKKDLFKSCMLLTGNHGVGKSVTVDVIAKHLGYEVKRLNVSLFKSGKNLEDIIAKIVTDNNIQSLISSQTKRRKIIVVDELESITSRIEKNSIASLQKLNDTKFYCPIIFISNDNHKKLISNIEKASYSVKLFKPYDSDMKRILIRIAEDEKIKFDNVNIVNYVVTMAQGDVRRLILILYDIKSAYHSCVITKERLIEYKKTTNIKDTDLSLYQATDKILYNYKSINQVLRLYESNKVILPLMVQQNYVPYIVDNSDDIELMYKISDLLSYGDVIEQHIYSGQNWNLQDIHGIYTCALPSYYLNTRMPDDTMDIKAVFAKDLHKTSIRSINKKNITKSATYLNNMSVTDYLYLSKIIRHHIKKSDKESVIAMLSQSGLRVDSGTIDTILKIDKIDNYKNAKK